jgi:hypothetical protein
MSLSMDELERFGRSMSRICLSYKRDPEMDAGSRDEIRQTKK